MWEIVRIALGAVAGFLALVCALDVFWALTDPKRHIRQQILRDIKKYEKGIITDVELIRKCPEGSLQFGISYTVNPPLKFIRTVRINNNF